MPQLPHTLISSVWERWAKDVADMMRDREIPRMNLFVFDLIY
jgi:hypothetical protein